MSPMERNHLRDGTFARKPSTWDEAPWYDRCVTPEECDTIRALPRIPLTVPFGRLPGDDGRPVLFVGTIGDAFYLVNTEGYDYARYVARLPRTLFHDRPVLCDCGHVHEPRRAANGGIEGTVCGVDGCGHMKFLTDVVEASAPPDRFDGAGFVPMNLDDCCTDPNDLLVLAGVYSQYAAYATQRAAAMQHRLEGNIHRARSTEATAETIYAALPEWARW